MAHEDASKAANITNINIICIWSLLLRWSPTLTQQSKLRPLNTAILLTHIIPCNGVTLRASPNRALNGPSHVWTFRCHVVTHEGLPRPLRSTQIEETAQPPPPRLVPGVGCVGVLDRPKNIPQKLHPNPPANHQPPSPARNNNEPFKKYFGRDTSEASTTLKHLVDTGGQGLRVVDGKYEICIRISPAREWDARKGKEALAKLGLEYKCTLKSTNDRPLSRMIIVQTSQAQERALISGAKWTEIPTTTKRKVASLFRLEQSWLRRAAGDRLVSILKLLVFEMTLGRRCILGRIRVDVPSLLTFSDPCTLVI